MGVNNCGCVSAIVDCVSAAGVNNCGCVSAVGSEKCILHGTQVS